MKQSLIKLIKWLVIIVLTIAISLLAILQWKSKSIVEKVLSNLEAQLTDSLEYTDISVQPFRHFPRIGLSFEKLQIGPDARPLVRVGSLQMKLGLLPLLRDQVDIRTLLLVDGEINIYTHKGRWSYDVFKTDTTEIAATTDGKGWQTSVHGIELNNTTLRYDDGHGVKAVLWFDRANASGQFSSDIVDMDLTSSGLISVYNSPDFTLRHPFVFDQSGQYTYTASTGTQTWKDWVMENGGIEITLEGNIDTGTGAEMYDLKGDWKDALPDSLKRWFPVSDRLVSYSFFGKSDGAFSVNGPFSSADISCNGKWKDAGFSLTDGKGTLKNLDIEFAYQSEGSKKSHPVCMIGVKKSSALGRDFEATLDLTLADKIVYNASWNGSLDAVILNLIDPKVYAITDGSLAFENGRLDNWREGQPLLQSILAKGNAAIRIENVKGGYAGNPLEISDGSFENKNPGEVHIKIDALQWDQAFAKNVEAKAFISPGKTDFNWSADFCQGKVEGVGTLSESPDQKIIEVEWRTHQVVMEEMMKAFSNFDQTFITDQNISGKANVWAVTKLPMDAQWKIKLPQVTTEAALEIQNGRLKDLKTLEDFSQYIHVEDLQDIRFNELRNYLKIEGSKIYLPVMFINSSAINLSISGVHGFDQRILYNMKLNAGQTIGNKLKKLDVKKEYKPSRKSGWINMYFILEGTTSNVKYQQYRQAVISNFEQSSKMKETLRQQLVDRFGYDVHWLEPNEWEEIPEYN